MSIRLTVPYILLLYCYVANAISSKRTELKPSDIQSVLNYHFNSPVPSSENPWIAGPKDKKYQFHIGQQSWIGAREICLAENSDLVTIESEEELEWILSHYRPQLKQFRERQLQVGLLVDNSNDDSSRATSWKWVSGGPLNNTLLRWVHGEPFDHAGGRERCAILNVNKKTIEDVDCDLSGNAFNFYRFICERTHLHHLKHEELNNPLWKKLEDILVFFGISQSSSGTANNETSLTASDVQLEDEDYLDNIKLKKTNASRAEEGSGEEPKSIEQQISRERAASTTGTDRMLAKTTGDAQPATTESSTQSTTTTAALTTIPQKDPSIERLEIVQLIEKQNKELIDHNLIDVDVPREQVQTALNLEGDFEDAKIEALAHPNTNSGDFLLLNKQEELIGCGAKNLESGTKPPPSSTTETVSVNKTEQINKLLESLRGFLANSSSDALSDLLVNGDDPKLVVEKLQKVAQEFNSTQPPTTTKSSEELLKAHRRIENEILKSLEDLRDVESQEFFDMKNNSEELLVSIGSGLEPPVERLITLTPVTSTPITLTAYQKESALASTLATEATKDEGFDATLMIHFPKKDSPVQTKVAAIPESEEDDERVSTKSFKHSPNFQQEASTKTTLDVEEEGSGSELDDKSMEKLNSDFQSVFPRPDFSLIKNKKLEAQNKKNLALEKRRVDQAYDQLNASFNSQSVLERIKQSEEERSKSQNGTIEGADSDILSAHDEQVAKTLEEIFNEWMDIFVRH